MFFSGAPNRKKVSLGGRSRAEESREEVLERTRLERERRQRHKAETRAATTLAAVWRGRRAARALAGQLRSEWAAAFGGAQQRQDGRDVLEQAVLQEPRCIGSLLVFFDPCSQADQHSLARVCQVLCSTAAAGTCTLLADAAAAASQHAVTADSGPSPQQLALWRVQRLALLCLASLSAGGPEVSTVLAAPMATVTARLQQQQQLGVPPAAALLQFLVKVINADFWKPSVTAAAAGGGGGDGPAAAGAAAVLRHLYQRHAMLHVRLLLAALPPATPTQSCAEALTTQLTVRTLAAQCAPPPLPPAASGAPAAAAAVEYGFSQLLFVPGLWAKAGSLRPVAGRLCFASLAELGQLSDGRQLVDVLLATAAAPLDAGRFGVGQQQQLQQQRRRAAASTTTPPAASVQAAAAAAAALVEAWVEAAAAGTLLRAQAADQASTAGKLVASLSLLLAAAKQLSLLQRDYWRRQQRAQQQQQHLAGSSSSATPSTIYDAAGPSGASVAAAARTSRKAGYVPGAGFVSSAAAAAAAAQQQQRPIEIDLTGLDSDTEDMEATPTAEAAAAAGGPGGGLEPMEVEEQPAPAAAPSEPGAPAAAAAAGGSSSDAAAAPPSIPAAAGAAGGGPQPSRNPTAAEEAVMQQPVAASAWSAEVPGGDRSSLSSGAAGASDSNSTGTGAAGGSGVQVHAVAACIHVLAGSAKGLTLLQVLVTALLPAASLEEAQQQQQQQPLLAPGGAVQQQLLELLWSLTRTPAYRQRIWLTLSVRARLVPRLWASTVLPLHLATPGGLLHLPPDTSTTGGASSRVRWATPLLVLCQAFSAALSYTAVEDLHAPGGSPLLLPLTQLYDPAAPTAGLLLLVKAAVWQVLWCNSVSPGFVGGGGGSGGHLSARSLASLKASVAEVCGLLLCQLHDRNCGRQFCPPAAFLCDLATSSPQRLAHEVAAAAARADVVAGGEDGEDGGGAGDGDAGWQQQQAWQAARQQGLGPAAAAAAAAAAGDGDAAAAGGAAAAAAAAAGGLLGEDDEPSQQGGGGRGGASAAPATAAAGGAGAPPLSPSAAAAAGGGAAAAAGGPSRLWAVLEAAPCLVPFEERVRLFQGVLAAEKEAAALDEWADPLGMGAWELLPPDGGNAPRFVTIRRDELLEDGFRQISRLDASRLRGRLRIQYVNEAGLPEAGIDGGGLFKEFMEQLLKEGFSPQSGLMAENPQHQQFPNPGAFAEWRDAEARLGFLGRMLGKCLYEGMLLELPLASFFLKKMRGGLCDINDLPSLDPEVYRHLVTLRHYTGDFADLSLTFTATVAEQQQSKVNAPGLTAAEGSSSSGRLREVELKPGGRDVSVTSDNVVEYIHRLADFRLNRQMDRAAAAFLRGFFQTVRPRWVRMFNEPELQALISGSEEGIDVDDLQAHVNYAGGYHAEHPVVATLWAALRSFPPEQQRSFLRFVTSCSRAPLLGFGHLEPRLCVQMSGGVLTPGSTERLPTAATCMNLLKLPPYGSLAEMRRKLLYAISAGAGFELS